MAETFDCFCIVELFGHARIAGKVTEQTIGGQGFIRVDVPATVEHNGYQAQPGFTRLFGPGAIYSITPVSEDIANRAAQGMRVEPVNVYYLPALPRGKDEDDDQDEDDGNDGRQRGIPF